VGRAWLVQSQRGSPAGNWASGKVAGRAARPNSAPARKDGQEDWSPSGPSDRKGAHNEGELEDQRRSAPTDAVEEARRQLREGGEKPAGTVKQEDLGRKDQYRGASMRTDRRRAGRRGEAATAAVSAGWGVAGFRECAMGEPSTRHSPGEPSQDAEFLCFSRRPFSGQGLLRSGGCRRFYRQRVPQPGRGRFSLASTVCLELPRAGRSFRVCGPRSGRNGAGERHEAEKRVSSKQSISGLYVDEDEVGFPRGREDQASDAGGGRPHRQVGFASTTRGGFEEARVVVHARAG